MNPPLQNQQSIKDKTPQEHLKQIGAEEQKRLKNSRVIIIGCGGVGSTSASILAQAGIGFLRIVDRDFLTFDDLQHQIIFKEHDVKEGLPKAIAAARHIRAINPAIKIDPVVTDINRLNIESLMSDTDLIIDGTDNLETRFLMNEACVKHGKNWIYGNAKASFGHVMNIHPGKTICFNGLMEKVLKKENISTIQNNGDSLIPIVFMIASLQCTEAIKYLISDKKYVNNHLLYVDLWKNNYQKIPIEKTDHIKNCPVCNNRKFDFLKGKRGSVYTSFYGKDTVQIIPFKNNKIDLAYLAIELSAKGTVIANEYLVRFKKDQFELTVFGDGRTIIKGTSDSGIARNIYKKYVQF